MLYALVETYLLQILTALHDDGPVELTPQELDELADLLVDLLACRDHVRHAGASELARRLSLN